MPKGLRHADASRVLAAVVAEPGARERRISKVSRLTVTVVRGHLRTLVRSRAVRAVEDATSRRYYPHGSSIAGRARDAENARRAS